MTKPFSFTMGADPEFNLMMRGQRLHASRTMENLFKDKRKENMGFIIPHAGNIGWDTNSETGEARPNPGKTAGEIVTNMRNLFQSLIDKAPLIDISTLSVLAPVGGHIHLSVPKEFRENAKITKIHRLLSMYCIPLILNDNKINMTIRKKANGYGTITDMRTQTYGSCPENFNGYEFRPLSAEWTTTPQIALGTLAYVGMIYNEIIKKTDAIKNLEEFSYRTVTQGKAIQDLILSDYMFLAKIIEKRIKTTIKNFEFYPIYEKEIKYILNHEKVTEDKKKAEYNIVKGWDLMKTKGKPSKRILCSVKAFKNAAKDLDLETSIAFSGISYNKDMNVELFAKTVSDRITVFNWKLENNYFIFGMKKGINEYIAIEKSETGLPNNIYAGKNLIKSQEDKQTILDLYSRMADKASFGNDSVTKAINKIIGTTHEKKTVIIGIPYDTRIDKNTTSLVKLIYNIENNRIKNAEDLNALIVPQENKSDQEESITECMKKQDNPIIDINESFGINPGRIISAINNATAIRQTTDNDGQTFGEE